MAGKRENVLGPCRCPLCGGAAEVRLSGSGFAYIAMDCCKAQLFTRGPRSDELARDLIGAAPAAPAPAPAPAPAAEETRYDRHERIAKEPPEPVRTSEPRHGKTDSGFLIRWGS